MSKLRQGKHCVGILGVLVWVVGKSIEANFEKSLLIKLFSFFCGLTTES